MIKDVDSVIEWLRTCGLKAWEVRTKDGDNCIIFQTKEDATEETNFDNFRKVMDLSKGGKYVIYATELTLDKKKGRFREEFENLDKTNISGCYNQGVPAASIPEGYMSRSELDSILAKERMSYKMERMENELEELKRENEKLNEPIKQFMSKLAPLAGPIVSGIMGRLNPAAAGVGIGTLETDKGFDSSETGDEFEISDDDSATLFESIKKWKEADSDYIILLQKIADMASGGNPFYDQAKQMLLKM